MRYIGLIAALLIGCGGGQNGVDGADGASVATRTVAASPTDCPAGGTTLSVGIDANRNGALDDSEIEDVVTTCNGQSAEGGIVATLFCSAPLDGTVSLAARYMAREFETGEVWAFGSIKDGFIEIGASSFYAPAQAGWNTAPVFFQFDVQGAVNGGDWKLSVDRETLTSVVDYTDADWPGGRETWTLPATSDSCELNAF